MISTRSGFGLHLRRLWYRRWTGSKIGMFLENFLQPFIVAIVVAFAYLDRGSVEPYRDYFLYFTTIYGFWVGMFGACQSVNRELESGEWSYWVLGCRRNKYCHVLSMLIFNFFISWIQTLFFVVLLVLVGWLNESCFGGNVLSHFIAMFISTDPQLVSPVFQMGGGLHLCLSTVGGVVIGSLMVSFAYFVIAMTLAVLSGSGFGLLFSVVFKDAAVSLNVSVGFVVLLGMLSLCGLRGTASSSSEMKAFQRAFWPSIERRAYSIVEERRAKEDAKKVAKESKMGMAKGIVWASYVLPQRYFFNFARLLGQRNLSSETTRELLFSHVKEDECLPIRFLESEFVHGSTNSVIYSTPWLPKKDGQTGELVYNADFSCPRTWSGFRTWVGVDIDEPEDNDSAISHARHFLRQHPQLIARWKVWICLKLIMKALAYEVVPISVIFLSCVLLSFALLKRRVYGVLR